MAPIAAHWLASAPGAHAISTRPPAHSPTRPLAHPPTRPPAHPPTRPPAHPAAPQDIDVNQPFKQALGVPDIRSPVFHAWRKRLALTLASFTLHTNGSRSCGIPDRGGCRVPAACAACT
jgi:hypothetical protein